MRLVARPLALLVSLALTHFAFAKEEKCCWIDVKTGKRVGSVPAAALIRDEDGSSVVSSTDDFRTNAFNHKTKQNYAKDADGCWIDVKTGKRVGSMPAAALIRDEDGSSVVSSTDDFRTNAFNHRTKQNYAREPCTRTVPAPPRPTPTPTTTDKVTDALRTIGSSISIGVGGGVTDGRHDHHDRIKGEDRTKTAEKLSNHKTHSTKTPSTSGKTVTSACKCHPCTCSPCHCH